MDLDKILKDTPPDIAKGMRGYLRHLEARRKAKRTLDGYGYVLNRLGRFLALSERHTLSTVDLESLQDYMHHLQFPESGPGVDRNTAALHHTVLKQWVGYLFDRDEDTCPLSYKELRLFEREAPGVRRHKPQVAWDKIGEYVMRLAGELRPPEGLKEWERLLWLRNHALYAVFYGSALRISELVSLDRTVIDQPELTIKGKGGSEREVSLSATALHFCRLYVAERQDMQPALFVSHANGERKTPERRLSVRAIQHIFEADRAAFKLIGLTPHKLRHIAAKHLLEQTGNMELVRAYLGHASITTTQIYAEMETKHVQAMVQTHHPAFRKPRTV